MDTLAKVTVRGPGSMSKAERKRIAKWLRSRANWIEKHGDLGVLRGWWTAKWIA